MFLKLSAACPSVWSAGFFQGNGKGLVIIYGFFLEQ